MLFRDRFSYCESKINFLTSKEQVFIIKKFYLKIKKCEKQGKKWNTYISNFNDIFNSFLTLFIVSTLDGWSEIMNVAVNSDLDEYVGIEYFLFKFFF